MAKTKKSTNVNVTACEVLQEVMQEASKPRLAASVQRALQKKKDRDSQNSRQVPLTSCDEWENGKFGSKSTKLQEGNLVVEDDIEEGTVHV